MNMKLTIGPFVLVASLLLLVACSQDRQPPAGINAEAPAPTAVPTWTSSPTSIPKSILVPVVGKEIPGTPAPVQLSAPTEKPAESSVQRRLGEYDGWNFNVGEGSKITFKVREQLLKLSFPNDAILKTDELDGVVFLDGGVSTITVDLHSLESDSGARDRYVQRKMFPSDRFAKFVVDSILPVPNGFRLGQEVTTQTAGTLTIKGASVPLIFDVTAQDLIERILISGRTIVTWEQLRMPKPTARSVLSVADSIKIEVELVIHP
jgi:hypothetical protein